jgi:hypothetical protein
MWACLELETERTIWGILEVDTRIGPLLTWRLDLRARLQMILDCAAKKHSPEDLAFLRGINKQLVVVTRDRNIVVHGAVHYNFAKQMQCWTIFRGAEAGKSFPVSITAVRRIMLNIHKLLHDLVKFNDRHKYLVGSDAAQEVGVDWLGYLTASEAASPLGNRNHEGVLRIVFLALTFALSHVVRQNQFAFARHARGSEAGAEWTLGAAETIVSKAPVAQLDRALDFESRGREFESLRARQ